MTQKEWNKLLIWCKTEKKPIKGCLAIYPNAIKYIENPNYWHKERAEKGQDIGEYQVEMKVSDKGIIVKEKSKTDTRPYKLDVPFKHIKSFRIYGYNY